MVAKRLQFCVLLFVAVVTRANAIEPSTSIGPLAEKGSQETAVARDDVEQKVLRLVEAHLPQLHAVLDRLRHDNPQQYEHAIRDLSRSAKRIEAAKRRDAKLYKIEIEMLQADSDVSLLAAKLKVRDDESDRNSLRKAIARAHEAKLTRARYDVQAMTERLQRTTNQLEIAKDKLEAIENRTDTELEQSYIGLLKKAGRNR